MKVQVSCNIIPQIEGDFHGTRVIGQLAVVIAINTVCFRAMRINKSMQRLHLVIALQLAADIGKVQRNIIYIYTV